jgi:CO/xanthine dehydrogenase Mo-binding subunit
MGIGYALSEQVRVIRGRIQTKYYGQLGVPTMQQTPKYHILLIEDPEPSGPYGAKGISEVGTVPMTAAIINAIADAVGVYITSLPATPEAILKAMQVPDATQTMGLVSALSNSKRILPNVSFFSKRYGGLCKK